MSSIDNRREKLSIIVPMHNESGNVDYFYERITHVLNNLDFDYEIVCINDGSKDDTLDRLSLLNKIDSRVKIIDLSRNFGKEIAMSAGIDYCTGDAIIPIDADLQDPPEIIPQLIEKWKEGYDVVYATRIKREGETALKKLTAHMFYRIMNKLSSIDMPADTGDFRLMTRPVVESLKELKEHHRFMKGLFTWVGYRQISVPYYREPRNAGKSNFNFIKLWNFAIEGITSFSFVPLQISSYIGFIVAILSFIYSIFLVVNKVVFGNPVAGYTSLMVAILFFGGAQLMSLGLIGEYIGRIYNESKNRPLYIVKKNIGLEQDNYENNQKEFTLSSKR